MGRRHAGNAKSSQDGETLGDRFCSWCWWFCKRVGLALLLVFGSLVLVPCFGWLSCSLGWRYRWIFGRLGGSARGVCVCGSAAMCVGLLALLVDALGGMWIISCARSLLGLRWTLSRLINTSVAAGDLVSKLPWIPWSLKTCVTHLTIVSFQSYIHTYLPFQQKLCFDCTRKICTVAKPPCLLHEKTLKIFSVDGHKWCTFACCPNLCNIPSMVTCR